MTVLSRPRVAAACAALSTAAVAGMVAATVFAGGETCDLRGCSPAAELAVATTGAVVDDPADACAAPTTTRSPAGAGRAGPEPCASPASVPASGAMATARVPAP